MEGEKEVEVLEEMQEGEKEGGVDVADVEDLAVVVEGVLAGVREGRKNQRRKSNRKKKQRKRSNRKRRKSLTKRLQLGLEDQEGT